jgi:RNA polymerase sigma-70 factor (ECF subfamily)
VRSALQRARATLAAADLGTAIPAGSLHAADGGLMARCVEALERDDVEGLAALIREDATTSAGDGWRRGPATLVAGVTHG